MSIRMSYTRSHVELVVSGMWGRLDSIIATEEVSIRGYKEQKDDKWFLFPHEEERGTPDRMGEVCVFR